MIFVLSQDFSSTSELLIIYDALVSLWESDYPDSSLDDTVRGFYTQQRQHFNEFSGFPTFATYVNYAHGDEDPNAWYGDADNLARLSAAKRKWDSNRLFGAAKPVPF